MGMPEQNQKKSEGAYFRRCADDLNVGGKGAIILGVWSVVKGILQLLFEREEIIGAIADDELTESIVLGIIIVLMVILSIVILFVHLYIGRNAIKASRGEKYKKGYLGLTVVAMIVMAAGMGVYKDMLSDLKNIDTTIAAMLVDLTTVYVFFIITKSTLKLRKYMNKAARE